VLGYEACRRAPDVIQSATRPYLTDLSDNNVGQLIDLLKRIGVGTVADWSSAVPRGN
jgi:hypothetical protein